LHIQAGKMKHKPIISGLILGGMSSITVMVVMYIGSIAAGLPFSTFRIFEFLTRVLPAGLVNFGLELMIHIVASLKLATISQAGKIAEQVFAALQFLVMGAVYGGILAALDIARNKKRFWIFCLGGAAVWVAGVFLIDGYLGFAIAGPAASVVWEVFIFVTWSLILGRMLRDIQVIRISDQSGRQISRREVMRWIGTSVVAVFAGLVWASIYASSLAKSVPGLGQILPMSSKTSGPAASPPQDVLDSRISPAPGTRPEITSNANFYRVDIDLNPPQVNLSTWKLQLDGLVENAMSLTLDEIQSRPAYSQYITLSCISNPVGGDLISTALITGMPLKDLLDEAVLKPGANEVYIQSADGYYESVVMQDMQDPRTLLVYEMNGEPLPIVHGYPLRIYIPGRYGMKQPKWITHMEVISGSKPGYWVERGWSEAAIVKTTSVIDAIVVQQSGAETALMGGIAYSGDVGIGKVEIQIDEGSWDQAELRAPPLSPLTWIQWRYQADIKKGTHTARVRAYDGQGQLQVLTSHGAYPDGATGVNSYVFSA
jgi:DMSO/TMAO reductase YedYZ molybdopterin-dependent catalytic subunit